MSDMNVFIVLFYSLTPKRTAPTTPRYNPNRPRTYRQKRPNCTPPAIEQFPPPLLPVWFRERGGLIIHVLIAIFTFLGLAIVCDDYFVSSLDRICEELRLSPDVAGATFMAAGLYIFIISPSFMLCRNFAKSGKRIFFRSKITNSNIRRDTQIYN